MNTTAIPNPKFTPIIDKQPERGSFTYETVVDYIQPHWHDSGQYEVHCPVCDFDCVYIKSSQHIKGNNDYDATADHWVRGDIVELQMFCENNHWWKLQIGFHKGHVAIRVVDPQDAPADE